MPARLRPSAFSLVEIMIVVVIMGILAAVAIPRFVGASDDARTAATESTVGAVRASIASYRTGAVIAGEDPFPSLAQLTDGTVVKSDLPANPFSGVSGVQSVSRGQAQNRTVVNATAAGWNYFYDNDSDPPQAVFYANSDVTTTRSDGAGGFRTANEL
jgi:prepilin-type N-terminal cleavage/methylation domain-containing protein